MAAKEMLLPIFLPHIKTNENQFRGSKQYRKITRLKTTIVTIMNDRRIERKSVGLFASDQL